jgi:hypothetical protein
MVDGMPVPLPMWQLSQLKVPVSMWLVTELGVLIGRNVVVAAYNAALVVLWHCTQLVVVD